MSEPAPRISERYHPTRLLGEGGFGEVWQAFDAVRREPVALKLMSRVVAEEARLRFQREAAALLGLDHPCIVRALGQGTTTDGIPFLVTELLRGQELRQRLTEQLSLSVPETADILQQICAGLSYMHERGLVHRDVKPSNAFLVEGATGLGRVKLLDVGMTKARGLETLTTTGDILGTPYYTSPEQIHDSKRVDSRSDLWALGVVVYECLTGYRPFEAKTPVSLYRAIDRSLYHPASSVGAPSALDAWFEKALHPHPDARFQTAQELYDGFIGVSVRARLLG